VDAAGQECLATWPAQSMLKYLAPLGPIPDGTDNEETRRQHVAVVWWRGGVGGFCPSLIPAMCARQNVVNVPHPQR